MSCVNENCSRNPLDCSDYETVIVNIDGDMACCKKCAEEYKKQKDHFLNVVIHDDKKYEAWLNA